MKQGIIFDMDGTLWDSAEGVAKSWTQVIAEEYRKDCVITVSDVHGVMGKTMDVIAGIMFPKLAEETRTELLAKCCIAENDYLREHGGILYEGLQEVLEELKKSYHLYIVSNCQSGYIEAFLDHYGFGDYFADTECYGNTKLPKSGSIMEVLKRNDLTDAIYVGDIQGDYDASRQAGIRFIHAAYGFGTIEDSVTEIHALSQLPKAIEEVWSRG